MLESAAGISTQVENESVVAIGNLATHHFNLGLDDLLHVASHSLGIVVSLSVDHDAMWNAFHIEYQRLEVADFEWRIVKNVEVLSAKCILLAWNNRKSGCNFPNIRSQYAHGRRTLQKTFEIHQYVRVIPKGMGRIQLTCSD